MAYTPFPDLLWLTVDPDAETCLQKEKPKKLVNMCAEKLVTDVILVEKYCLKLPKAIHLLMFSTAIAKKRTLSIEKLMKFCPHETLKLPVPDLLKLLQTVPHVKKSNLEHEMIDFSGISMTMLSVFFDLIKKNNYNSELQTLDLGFFPLRTAALLKIQDFLLKQRRKVSLFTKAYTLKCTIAVENSTDLHILRMCSEKSTSLGFHLNITGVYFYNNFIIDLEAIKLFDSLEKSNLELIAFSFAAIIPNFNAFFNELKLFKFVKYLNLSYLQNLLVSDIDARRFAFGLIKLINLQRLVLKGVNLNGMLSTLFLEYCKKNQNGVSSPDCCFVHSGSLCYLDISSCSLSDRDLQFLEELSITNSLKYLDVSENSLHERAFQILLCLKCSLQALNISSCFMRLSDYDDATMPFSDFTQLKYLNIKGLHLSGNSKHQLEHELQKMPSLKIIETSMSVSLIDVIVL